MLAFEVIAIGLHVSTYGELALMQFVKHNMYHTFNIPYKETAPRRTSILLLGNVVQLCRYFGLGGS